MHAPAVPSAIQLQADFKGNFLFPINTVKKIYIYIYINQQLELNFSSSVTFPDLANSALLVMVSTQTRGRY